MLPANGRLLIPEGSASCVCAFPLQTSMGFIPVTSSDDAVPLLEDFPPLAKERVKELYAWDFTPDSARGKTIRCAVGAVSLTAANPVEFSEHGLVLDGQQWLADKLEHPDLPSMPVTLSLEARVEVSEGTPEWSGLIGAIQDNGSFERGCLLGIQNNQFFLAIASEHQASLTYLKAPAPLKFGEPYHVVGTYDGSNMRLYVNGKLIGITSAQSGAVRFEQKSWLSVGIYKDDDDHHPLRGVLSHASIFRGALSAEQVRARYDNRSKSH